MHSRSMNNVPDIDAPPYNFVEPRHRSLIPFYQVLTKLEFYFRRRYLSMEIECEQLWTELETAHEHYQIMKGHLMQLQDTPWTDSDEWSQAVLDAKRALDVIKLHERQYNWKCREIVRESQLLGWMLVQARKKRTGKRLRVINVRLLMI
ncbi:hypothetical protein RUND412_006311 [Rhizina undulata]